MFDFELTTEDIAAIETLDTKTCSIFDYRDLEIESCAGGDHLGHRHLSTSLMGAMTVVSTFIAATIFAAFFSEESYSIVFAVAGVFSLTGAAIIAINRILRLSSAEEPTIYHT